MRNTFLKDPVLLASLILVSGFIGSVIILSPHQSNETKTEREPLYLVSTLDAITNVTNYKISNMPIKIINHIDNMTQLEFENGYKIYPYGNWIEDSKYTIYDGEQ